jgi:broad specificity phosphatase PhoE
MRFQEKSMSNLRLSLLCILLAILPMASGSQPLSGRPAWLNDMRLGGYVIILRHGATVSDDEVKIDSMNRKDVSGERQLNAQGRAQAQSIGESMRQLGIPVDMVLTSTIQRAVDSATLLGFGPVTATPDLAEGTSSDERDRRALALRKLVATPPPPDNNVVIVSHKPNIVDAFGTGWSDVREGEASVFEPDRLGGYKLIARIQANDWSVWAHTAD